MGTVEDYIVWLREDYGIEVRSQWLRTITSKTDSTSIQDIHSFILEKLMNSNLREVTEGCFKETDFFEKGELWGTYLVQITSCRNVCASMHSKTPKNEINSKRLLLMEITDGKVNLKAIEYKPIPALESNLKLGSKIIIKGVIKYHLNTLLLKTENVIFLGGSLQQQKQFDALVLSSFLTLKPYYWLKFSMIIIKAHVLRVTSSIVFKNHYWYVKLIVEDDFGFSHVVLLSNKILETLIGFSASFFIKNFLPNKKLLESRLKVGKAISLCQYFISNLNCFMILQKISNVNFPVVVKLLKFL